MKANIGKDELNQREINEGQKHKLILSIYVIMFDSITIESIQPQFIILIISQHDLSHCSPPQYSANFVVLKMILLTFKIKES